MNAMLRATIFVPVFALAGLLWTPSAATEEFEHWLAADNFAPWVTGDIDVSPTKIIFQTGQELLLSHEGSGIGLNLAPYGALWPDEIFRIIDPPPLLKEVDGPGKVCPEGTATYITISKTRNRFPSTESEANELGLTFFYGDGPLTRDNYKQRFCGGLFYVKAPKLNIS